MLTFSSVGSRPKRENSIGMCSEAMPRPWSRTLTETCEPRFRVVQKIAPPAGEYLMALSKRFAMTVAIRARSPSTCSGVASTSRMNWWSGDSGRKTSSCSWTTSPRSNRPRNRSKASCSRRAVSSICSTSRSICASFDSSRRATAGTCSAGIDPSWSIELYPRIKVSGPRSSCDARFRNCVFVCSSSAIRSA